MSITTYSELQTALANWLDRSDLTTRIPEFIALFEAKLNRRLLARQQVTFTTLSPSSGSASLPSDYLAWKRVRWNGSPYRDLKYATPSFVIEYNPTGSSATPQYFTIEGSTLKVAPVSDTPLDFLYAQKVPALSDSATTNWLLTAHPDVYLYGSLVESATFTSDDRNGRAWNELVEQRLGEIALLNFRGNDQMSQRVATATP